MLKRYWIVLHPEDKYGSKNIGVTANSLIQAKEIATSKLMELKWLEVSPTFVKDAQIIENIDVRLLDQNHVIPNIGPVTFTGIWFPNINI